MNRIDFGGQRSRSQLTYMEILEVKVTIDIHVVYRNKLVNMIETKPLCASVSNLVDMLAIVKRWTLLNLEVRGQGHNRHIVISL